MEKTKRTNIGNAEENQITHWVYILEQEDHSYLIKYGVGSDPAFGMIPLGSRLIFCRSFRNVIDGLGFKSLLDRLSQKSIERIITNEM